MEIQPKDTSKGHFYVSLLKGATRIAAAFCLIFGEMVLAGTFFIIAEILGIVEEVV